MLTGLFKDASFGPLLNLHVYFLLAGVFRFGQCFGKRFSPISNFNSPVSSRKFRDAQQSRFWCGDPKVCIQVSLKMLDLALSQIYTRVFHFRKSVGLENAWDGDSRPFILFSLACFRAFRDAPHSCFFVWDLKLCLRGSLKMLVSALLQIYASVFLLCKSIDLDSA